MAGPLAGIHVLEFSEVIAAPFAGLLLSDMGASVIKVEPPEGEPWRYYVPFMPTESRWYIALNRGKRDLTLDLTKPQAQEVVGRLLPDMDVALVNYRPDVAQKLGIDYETLSTGHPRLIYCDNTAFGRKGPQAHRPGYDLIAQGLTGVMATEGKIQDGVPSMNVIPTTDYLTGALMAWSVCAALFVRERTGRGQRIDTTLLASALAMQANLFQFIESVDIESRQSFLEVLARGREEGMEYEELREAIIATRPVRPIGNVHYRVFKTKDSYVVVGALAPSLRTKHCEALGFEDERIGDLEWDTTTPEAEEYCEKLVQQVEAIYRERTTEEWLELLDEKGIPAGPFKLVQELADDPQIVANDLQVVTEHSLLGTVRGAGVPLQMSETPLEVQGPSPTLGEHTDEILGSLGYSGDDIASLREGGVIR